MLSEFALCLDFPSLLLALSRFDEDVEGSGEEASRMGRYREDRGLTENLVVSSPLENVVTITRARSTIERNVEWPYKAREA